ncbi:wax ester synthase/diacylglycerol acyltransferase 11 isoform X1 [Beta vulgaris subsp. vulgaris]|uniref:wax ester synthase/diacylglycerol acyltransferase 11 isoform X1 n=1 Tax=Beta vulgaris subsp. vulgaris TaxID=3555 RepID=UPI002036A589|nr:wax ester synthase/diacylglycerol acyltransferase 11 isoform X1 [Beta vulgaris subsp. vulgaris]
MDYVIRRRKSGSMKRGIIQPLEINCNRELVMLDNEERIELLSPASAAFHKPDFNIHVLAIMGVKVPVNVELLKAKFPSTLCKHPRFSSVVEGNPCKGEKLRWTRTEVNLDKHIIVPKINPENIDSPEKYVEDYIYNLSKTTLDKSRPLWDVHVLNLKLSEDVKAVTVFRVHHSLGDGTSLISLLLALTRKTSDPEALPTIPASKLCNDDNNNNNNTRKGLFWKWAIALWMILKLFWNTSIDILLFVATTLFLKDNCPFKSSPEGANAPRRVVYKIFSLDDMKFVKNAIGGTINDVAVGITQAGLSQYLYRKYGNKGDTNEDTRGKMKRFLSNIRLRSVLLVNIRPSGGVQALADMMEKDAEVKWGNSVGFMLLPFTLGLHDDPLDYIRDAKTRVDKKKHSFEAIYTFFMAEIVMKFFGSKVASVISDRINSHTTMGFSNLPGPVEDVAFYGLPLAFVAPSSYGQPHAVLINFQSYSDKMTIVLAVDEYTVPDPHQLCDDIVDSLKLIKDAVIKQGIVKPSCPSS